MVSIGGGSKRGFQGFSGVWGVFGGVKIGVFWGFGGQIRGFGSEFELSRLRCQNT